MSGKGRVRGFVHLALLRQDDLAAAAGRVDGQSLLERVLDLQRRPTPTPPKNTTTVVMG